MSRFLKTSSTVACFAFLLVASALTGCAGTSANASTEGSAAEIFDTPLDLAEARSECLQSKGWDSTLDSETGHISTFIPTGQEEAYQEADAECFSELGVNANRSLTSSEFDTIYQSYLEGKECLEAEGYSITEAPSRQVFEQEWGPDPWVPWGQVSESSLGDALEACPIPEDVF